MTIADLGFAIDSSPLANASSELDKLSSSAAKAEQAASRVSGAGTRMSRGFADLNPSLEKIVGSLGRLEGITMSIDKRLDAMATAASRAAKGNIVLEKSAIEASTAYKALEASLAAVTASQSKADAAQAKSLAQIQKQKDAIAALNVELQKLRNAPLPGSSSPNRPTSSPANSNFQTGNIAAQLFDTFSTAPFMSPTTVGLQQGPQLAQAFAGQTGKQALTGLASGFAAIVSPVSLAAIGLTTAAAAAISYGTSVLGSLGSVNTAFEKHTETIAKIKETWDQASDANAQYGRRAQSSIQFEVNQDRIRLNKALDLGLKDFAYRATPQVDASQYNYPGADLNAVAKQMRIDQFGPFAQIIERFVDAAREGKGDILDLNRQVQELANTRPDDKYFQAYAAAILKLSENATKAASSIEELRKKEREYRDTFSRTDAAANANKFQADTDYARLSMTRRYDAEVSGIGARSPSERAAAERRRLEAEPIDPKEDPSVRALRIEQQIDLMTRRAQQQISEARRDRGLNLDKLLTDQRNEIDLIGKTGGAAEALRKQYELTSQLRLEAARQGIDVDQRELDLIKERTKALGEMVDQYNQRRFDFDINRQASDARLSTRDRQIVTTLRSYGLPEDLGGANAARIGQQIDWEETKGIAKSFFTEMQQAAFESGGNIGDAIVQAALNAANKALSKAVDNLFDKLANGVADWLIGGGSSGSGTGSALSSIASVAFSGKASNDNASSVATASAYAAAIKSIESAGSGGYSALGPVTKTGDRAYGAYQVMGANIGPWSQQALGRSVSVDEFMANPSIQDKVFQSKFGSYVNSYGPAGAAQAWFGGPGSVGKGSSWTDQLGTSGTEYVDKFTKAVGGATDNLASFGGGLDKMGQSLLNAFPSAPAAATGGVGLSGILGNLFGNLTNGPGSQWARAQSGAITGLFANGTNYAPGGLAIVGEDGPEIVNLPQGSQVFNTNKSAQMMSAANQNGSSSAANGQSVVRISLSPELIGQILSEAQGQTIDIVKENNKGQAELYMNGQSR